MTSGTVLLAHQGGWDEILLVAAPVGLFVVLLWVANARAARTHAPHPHGADRGSTVAGGPDGSSSPTDVDDPGRR